MSAVCALMPSTPLPLKRGATTFLRSNEEVRVGRLGLLSQRDCYLAV